MSAEPYALTSQNPKLITSKTANNAGTAVFNLNIPMTAPNLAWVQAVSVAPGAKSAQPYRARFFDQACTADSYEPNDAVNSASRPQFGLVTDATLGHLTACGDEDYYTYTLFRDDVLDFELVFAGNEGELEYNLYEAATGNLLSRDSGIRAPSSAL